MELKGLTQTMKTAQDHYSSSTKHYSWHYAFGQVEFSWHSPNPDSSFRLPDGEAWFITSENAFPLHQCPMAVSFTPLQPTLGNAHVDLRLVCGCSTMEIHFMKLPTDSLELCSECCNRGQNISALGCSVQWICVACHFSAEPSLLLDVSTSK